MNFRQNDLFLEKIQCQQKKAKVLIEEIFHDTLELDQWSLPIGYGTSGFCQGNFLEKGTVSISIIDGPTLPDSATSLRKDLSGQPYQAMGISIVLHPDSPLIPTAHANIRKFTVLNKNGEPHSWFGGGFDLTPYFVIDKYCMNWHKRTYEYLTGYDSRLYSQWKKSCDDYFYLHHRNEPRGIGGIFFDDFIDDGSLDKQTCVLGIIDLFFELYFEMCRDLKDVPYTINQKKFQEWRRGRYVEFNLLFDRGTHFGIQSKGRIEAVLSSLPPLCRWLYHGDQLFAKEQDQLIAAFKKYQKIDENIFRKIFV